MASFEVRGKSVRVIVRLPGGVKKTATFDTRSEARKWAMLMESKVDAVGPPVGKTNMDLFETYLDAVASKTDSAKFNGLRLMKWCKDPLANLRTEDTTTHDINQWIERSLITVSSSTVNRELNLMSGAFTYAVKALHWIEVNPCKGARRPERGRARKRPLLSQEEIAALCAAAGYVPGVILHELTAKTCACFLLALETGMRSGEILRARPQDYWPDRRTLHVAAIEAGGRKSSKSGTSSADPSRNVPLTGRAMQIIQQLLDSRDVYQPYIVGLRDDTRDALWRKTMKHAGVEDLHFHDAKHEAATKLSRFIDVLALSHAIGTKDIRLLRDTYYDSDAERTAKLLPDKLAI